MMNFSLSFIPERPKKARNNGITMVMDKGLSLRETEDFISACHEYTDVVKFGFGTAVISSNLEEKLRLYRDAGIRPYFGGTLFELFLIRDQIDNYRKLIDKYRLDLIEISDGSICIPHEEKLNYIRLLSRQATVFSEVGSKVAGVVIPTEKWIEMMVEELKNGAWKVIAEARESGNTGIYNADGSSNKSLIDQIVKYVGYENVIWEAPNKPQQAWFIKLLGANVNLGNIAPSEVIPLETLRLGLRGDTFFEFLPENLKCYKPVINN
jgi:phosphosulfolactate synthase